MKNYIEEYVNINGIKQYFLHYPFEAELVILYLHGGPGQTEAHFAYHVKDERLKCSVVYYDQRGTGKTQLKNRAKHEDIKLDVLMEEYFKKVQAPKKGLYWIEDAGHLPILDNPKSYNDALLKIIEELCINI